jgi:hypothetical protein
VLNGIKKDYSTGDIAMHIIPYSLLLSHFEDVTETNTGGRTNKRRLKKTRSKKSRKSRSK